MGSLVDSKKLEPMTPPQSMKPVKTRQTQARKEVALFEAASGGTKTSAAKAAGVNRRTLYQWFYTDLVFHRDFDAAWTIGNLHLAGVVYTGFLAPLNFLRPWG